MLSLFNKYSPQKIIFSPQFIEVDNFKQKKY